jgi:hypothetical protein
MDHLVCFLPGAVAPGLPGGKTEAEACKAESCGSTKERQMRLAKELMKPCCGMCRATETGIAPENVWFSAADEGIQPYRLRPTVRKAQSHDFLASWKEDHQIHPLDAPNLQRAETVESLFVIGANHRGYHVSRMGMEDIKSLPEAFLHQREQSEYLFARRESDTTAATRRYGELLASKSARLGLVVT